MTRIVKVAAAQLGPVQKSDDRPTVVKRMLELMKQAKDMNCDLVVFPEMALTTFFPRWYMEDQAEIDQYFEKSMPNAATQPLFDFAKTQQLGFYLGYCELAKEEGEIHHYNTSILVGKDGEIIGKYRKVHLPGHRENEPWRQFQHLEKRYFEVGNTGFKVWDAFGGKMGMALCNDRRWSETYRVMGLQGVEMVMIGYNTPVHNPPAPEHDNLSHFHNQLVMQAGAYQNGTWVIGVGKAGNEEGVPMIGNSSIVAPSGEIVASATTTEDELIVARCDLDLCNSYKRTVFNFNRHRQPQYYSLITEKIKESPELQKLRRRQGQLKKKHEAD